LRLRLMCIYSFLRYLVENDKLPSSRFVRKIRIKIPQTLPKAMSPNDVSRLLAVVSDIRNRAMILVLLRTGIRIGELLNLKVYDVRFSEQKALIWEGEKNSVGRVVCLSADAILALRRWFDIRDPDKEYVFYSRRSHIMGYATARIMFKKYLDKAGLANKNYGLHSLRHTFATDLLNAGMRLECLQQLLGHSSLEMTLRYARLSDQTREEEFFRAMARIEGGPNYEPDPLDYQFPPSSQTPELLHTHG
jgi:integrase/recombinase XerD